MRRFGSCNITFSFTPLGTNNNGQIWLCTQHGSLNLPSIHYIRGHILKLPKLLSLPVISPISLLSFFYLFLCIHNLILASVESFLYHDVKRINYLHTREIHYPGMYLQGWLVRPRYLVASKFSDTLTLFHPRGQILPTISTVAPKASSKVRYSSCMKNYTIWSHNLILLLVKKRTLLSKIPAVSVHESKGVSCCTQLWKRLYCKLKLHAVTLSHSELANEIY